ncbi:MAG: recombinase family protein [Eggerthellaceae bacterium]|nr:recombinase family protein [Eggerthellaceae bacterium]
MHATISTTTTSSTEQGTWRAASYTRLSREDQMAGESNSIASQRKLIDDWAAERSGVQIVARYSDDGWSGATFDRPGFQQMIADAQAGRFDTIVVKDLSRFGRSYLDCGSWIERELPRLGVRLYSIADDFDSMQSWDYNMALLLPIKNLMNEMLVITTSEKVRTSLAAKRRRGEFVSNFAPYGYVKDPADPHRLRIDPEAADVVRRIFDWRLEGRSAREIARMLNARGIPCPTLYRQAHGSSYQNCFCGEESVRWHAKTVLRILRNEVYTGALAQGKTRRPNWRLHMGMPVPRDQWQRTERAHEAVVSRDDFEAVAQLLSKGTYADDKGPSNC